MPTADHTIDLHSRRTRRAPRPLAAVLVSSALLWQGRVASWYQGAALMKGYSAEEAIDMPLERLFTNEERLA